jgi:Fe-S-cluster-containing dehydrogenase component
MNRLSGVMRDISPCAGCAERHIACHDNCSQYKAWKAEAEKINEARRAYIEDRTKVYEDEKRRNTWLRTTFKKG